MTRLSEKRWQIFTAIVANIIGIVWGASIGWSSPVLAKMTGRQYWKNSPLDFKPDAEQQSYIACMLPFGAMIGAILASPCTSLYGRKFSLIFSANFFIFSFFILIVTDNLFGIYIARFMQGIGDGITMVALPIYIGEISSVECRGILTNFINISAVLGILLAYSCGPYLNYISFQIVCLIIPIIFIISFSMMPETPYYYLMQGDKVNAIKSLKFLHRNDENEVENELKEIYNLLDEHYWTNESIEFEDIFKGRGNRRALVITVGLICLQSFIGIDAILFYGQIIFRESGTDIDSSVATIIIGFFMVISSFLTLFFVDSVGRKCLLLVSAAGMGISLAAIGSYFYLAHHIEVKHLGWLPVMSLIGFIIFFCLGFGPLPFTILSEMFAPEIKSTAVSFAITVAWLGSFAVTMTFLPLENVIYLYGNFWVFSSFCAIAFAFTAIFVFETKGLTMNQIQLELNKNYILLR